MRNELKKPLQKIVTNDALIDEIKHANKVVTVGDVSSLATMKKTGAPDIAIVDYRVSRLERRDIVKEISGIGEKVVKIKNPPGTLTRELWRAIEKAYESKEKVRIEVDGEEDLSALACIALAPKKTVVIYGIPNKGMAIVHVDEEAKNRAERVLQEMGRW